MVLWAHIIIVGLPYCTYTLGTVGSNIVGLPYCTYTLGTVGSHNHCRSPILYIYPFYCGLTYCRSPMFSVCCSLVHCFCNLISAASKKTPLHHSKLKFSSVTSVYKRVRWFVSVGWYYSTALCVLRTNIPLIGLLSASC